MKNNLIEKRLGWPMNSEMIEEKDLLLTKKIREILKNKEILKKEEILKNEERILEQESEMKPVWQRPGFWLVILCAGGIMTGLMIFRGPSPIIASNSSGQGTEAAVEESNSMVPTITPAPVVVAESKEIEPKEIEPVQQAHPEETAPFLEIDSPEKEAVPPKDHALAFEDTLSPEVSAETRTVVQANPAEHASISSGIRISEIVSCSSITKRQYTAPQKVFSLKKDATAAIWMNVVSDEQPFTLTHVYYLNGIRYCSVPLEIRYKSMRTWSNVTLGLQAHLGEWRVEVITGKGEKLDQIEFTVVP